MTNLSERQIWWCVVSPDWYKIYIKKYFTRAHFDVLAREGQKLLAKTAMELKNKSVRRSWKMSYFSTTLDSHASEFPINSEKYLPSAWKKFLKKKFIFPFRQNPEIALHRHISGKWKRKVKIHFGFWPQRPQTPAWICKIHCKNCKNGPGSKIGHFWKKSQLPARFSSDGLRFWKKQQKPR